MKTRKTAFAKLVLLLCMCVVLKAESCNGFFGTKTREVQVVNMHNDTPKVDEREATYVPPPEVPRLSERERKVQELVQLIERVKGDRKSAEGYKATILAIWRHNRGAHYYIRKLRGHTDDGLEEANLPEDQENTELDAQAEGPITMNISAIECARTRVEARQKEVKEALQMDETLKSEVRQGLLQLEWSEEAIQTAFYNIEKEIGLAINATQIAVEQEAITELYQRRLEKMGALTPNE